MTIGKNRLSGQSVAGLARSFRVGISATSLLLAGTALAPATAQVLDLGGLTVTRTDLTGFTEVTNGVLRINPVPAFSYGFALTDSLGAFALTKIGSTTLTLTGTGLNTYSGLTTVSSGLLLAGASNVLSPNSVAAINAGRIDIAGFNQTVAGLTGGGQLENSGGAATMTINTAGDLVYNGVISGSTTVVMNGSGRQSFGAASTYTGGTTLNSGILGFVNSQAFGTGAITVAGAAELQAITLALTLGNDIVLNADLTALFGQNVTWSGVVSGGAANQLIKEGNGKLTLTGNNSFAGGTTFNRGQINVSGNSAFGAGTITTTATQVTMGTDGNISAVVNNAIVLNGFMNFELPDVGNTLTLNGPISGPGALYLKTGNGTLVLNSANTISAPTLLASGFLGLGDDAAAGTGTIRVSGTGGISAYDNVAVANAIRTSNNTVVDTRGFNIALNGVIRNDSTGPGGIEKVGTGVLTLSADNVYTAETFVNAGTLIIDGSITSDTYVASGATLGGSGSVADANLVTVSSGGILSPGPAGGGAGTLTVGNLFLGAGSIFDVELSDPNVIGSSVNDLIIVTDTLTLDGATINVLALPGFQSGTYRVMEFTNLAPGALLIAGTAPPTYAFTIDINSALGQVNLLVAQSAIGPVQYWDGNDLVGIGGVAGGNGTWNAANTNWTDSVGSANAVWGSGTGIFQTVGGTVSVVGTQLFENLTFSVDGYVLNGGNLQTNGSTLAVTGGSTATINSTLIGTNGIIKTGSGNLVLNAANGYAGDTTINGGTVTVGDNDALSGGVVRMVNNTTLAAGVSGLVVTNDINVSGTGIIGTGGFDFTLSGIIADGSGPGRLDVRGAGGTLNLTGVNTYSGGTNVNSDVTLVVFNDDAIGTGLLTLQTDATLANGSAIVLLANDVTTIGNGLINAGPLGLGITGDIGGPGSISQIGTGILYLSGNNSFTNLGINQGTVVVDSDTAAGIGNIAINNDATLANGTSGIVLDNDVQTTGNGLIFANGDFTLKGNISGAGSISQIGAGNLILNGDNSFTNLGINQGTVTLGADTAAGIGTIAINNDATLAAGVSDLNIANDITTTANGLVDAGPAGFIFTLDGDIGGPGSISQIGLGNLVLNGNNSFTNLGINAGIVTLGTDTAAGIGTIAINNDATLAAGVSGLNIANDITTTANGLVDAGPAGFVFTLNGDIGGAGSISQVGLGNLVLNGNNSFTNLGINAGIVTLGTDTAAGNGTIAINDDATLAAGVTGLNIANDITTTANGLVDAGPAGFVFTLNGDIGGPGSISQIGLGNLVLNGNNSFTNLGINAGIVTLGTDTAAGIGFIAINNDATLAAGVTGLNIANDITTTANGLVDAGPAGFVFTLNGDIGGPGSISQIGAGNLVLNGNNSFTNLGINQGIVTLGTDTAAGIGTIAINNDATLAAGVSGLNIANDIITTANGLVDAGPAGFVFTLNGDIGGAGSISQIGAGNLVLNGDNSFTNLGINQGAVTLGSDTAAGIGNIAINNDATLAAGVSGLNIANDITTTANGLVDAGPAGFVFTLNGDIGGPGSISQIGAGNLVLNGDNSFTNLGINQGTVTLGSDTAAGIGTIAINNDATLAAGANGLVIANAITTTANGLVDAGPAGNVFTLAGDIGGAGSISQVGLGNLVLNGNNSFTNLGINAGTVTVGTETAAGIGAIAINNDATLAAGANGLVLTYAITTTANGIVDAGGAGNVFTLNGDIGGAGSISQVGLGNLVLNGDNSFTNLGINAGTVTVGTETAAGIGAIAINNNATLAAGANGLVLANAIVTTANGLVDAGPAGNVFTLDGDIGGAGSISQVGLGNLVLNGDNSFTNLGINAGTVTVSTNTAAGIGSIAINNGATLAAGVSGLTLGNLVVTTGNGTVDSGAGTFTLAGTIAGAGSITKTGTGTLTLTGANSFGGGMTIAAGTVVGSAASVGPGAIVNDGALVFDQASDATYANVISGTGSLTKAGVGMLTLSAANTLTGPTTVSAGILNVTGSLANSATTVQSGGALWGTGSVGSLTVQAGGTVAPGAVALQSGTLTVNGALTLASGSTLVIDAGSDLLKATGTSSIAGNLVVNPIGSGFRFGEQVIVSSSARTGQFASTSFSGGFGPAIAPTISYTATSVILELNPISLVAAGGSSLSPNSFEVASAFDRAVANGYDANPFFALYNQGPNLNNALLQLSGELHSAERRVLLEDTRIVRETAFDRLNTGLAAIAGNQQVTSDVNGGDITFWLRGAGSWGNANADGIGSDFSTSQWGVLTGVDYAKDGFKVGAMFFYTSTDIDFTEAQLGKSNVDTTGGAIYGGYRSDMGWAVGMGGAYAGVNANGTRTITAPGLGQTLEASIGGTSYQVFGEIAYDFMAAPEIRVEPFGRIAYAGVDSNDFREVGGIAAIEADSQSNDLTIFNLGLRAAYDVGAVRISGAASWQNTSGDRSGGVTSTITGLDSLMYIQAVALDGDAANLEAQVSYGFTDKIRLGIGYSGLIGPNNSDNGVRATLSVGF